METKSIMQEIRANLAALASCERHQFPERGNTYRPGTKLTCLRCGGTMSLTDAGNYLRGYAAHGGDPRDIIPDWPSAQPGGSDNDR